MNGPLPFRSAHPTAIVGGVEYWSASTVPPRSTVQPWNYRRLPLICPLVSGLIV